MGVLGAGAHTDLTINLTSPSTDGTYYYGACVDAVSEESQTGNNCSRGVAVTVGGSDDDDHGDTFDAATVVSVPSTTAGELEAGGDKDYFRLSIASDATLAVETTGSTDTFGTLFDDGKASLETNDDGGTGTNFRIERDVDAGTYYVEVRGYGSSTTGEYELSVSSAARGGSAPDLVVDSASVDDATPDSGGTITFSATVRNAGDGTSDATTLRYYRSSDSTITAGDTEVGTDRVAGLAAGVDSAESISLTVPSDAGTYYYGACVDSVSGESSTTNNCSDGVAVEVSGGNDDSYCRDDDTLQTGERCDLHGTTFYFEVEANGRGCLRAGGVTSCNGNSISVRNWSINGIRVTLVASRNDDDSWTIDDVDPEPD